MDEMERVPKEVDMRASRLTPTEFRPVYPVLNRNYTTILSMKWSACTEGTYVMCPTFIAYGMSTASI